MVRHFLLIACTIISTTSLLAGGGASTMLNINFDDLSKAKCKRGQRPRGARHTTGKLGTKKPGGWGAPPAPLLAVPIVASGNASHPQQ